MSFFRAHYKENPLECLKKEISTLSFGLLGLSTKEDVGDAMMESLQRDKERNAAALA
jgi:hypothetical protein